MVATRLTLGGSIPRASLLYAFMLFSSLCAAFVTSALFIAL